MREVAIDIAVVKEDAVVPVHKLVAKQAMQSIHMETAV